MSGTAAEGPEAGGELTPVGADGTDTPAVTVIGMLGDVLPPGGAEAVAMARVVVGTSTHLNRHAPEAAHAIALTSSDQLPDEALAALAKSAAAEEPAVVLVEGDPGYFGVLRSLRVRGVAVVVLPAVSAVQRAAALAGRPWDDMTVVNTAGQGFRHAVNVCRARRAVGVLTAPGAGPAELAAALDGWRRTMIVVEDQGGTAERMSIVDAQGAAGRHWRDPNVVLCLAEADDIGEPSWAAGGEPTPPAQGWGLDQDAFAQRDGVASAAELRAIALARLAPRPGTLVWDVAAGSGALGVEAARLGAAVVAVERDPGLCVRIVANATKYGVDVRLVEGAAPEGLAGLPQPDSVFVGDSRAEVVRACAGVGASRVVVVVEQLANVEPARDVLASEGYRVRGCQMASAPLTGVEDGAVRLTPAASAFLLWGVR